MERIFIGWGIRRERDIAEDIGGSVKPCDWVVLSVYIREAPPLCHGNDCMVTLVTISAPPPHL